MEDLIGVLCMLIGCLAVPTFFILGIFGGMFFEKKHFRELAVKEAALNHITVTDLRRSHESGDPTRGAMLVTSEVAISSDYLKTFICGWIKIFGGELTPFMSLMERARREAIVRLKEQAVAQGYDAIGNIRLEGVDLVGVSPGKNPMVMVCIVAAGTAYKQRG